MDEAVEILRAKGFTVTGRGTYGRYVFVPATYDDDVVWWNNLARVFVGVGDTLVSAHRVPAIKAEQDRLVREWRATRVREQQEAKARQAAREALRAAGLKVSDQGLVDIEILSEWLKTTPSSKVSRAFSV
jgi:hypothetical protein